MLKSLAKEVNKWGLRFDEVFDLLKGRTEDADFKHRFSSFIDEYACALEATGVVTLNRDTDNIPFVNTKALNGLIIDSIRQVHEKVIGLENQFKALQGGCP